LDILVVVNHVVVAEVRNDIGMEEVYLSQVGRLIYVYPRSILFVDPELRKLLFGIGLSDHISDVGADDIVVEEYLQLSRIVRIILFRNSQSTFPDCHVVALN